MEGSRCELCRSLHGGSGALFDGERAPDPKWWRLMAQGIDIQVSYSGGLFHRDVRRQVEDAMVNEILEKIRQRAPRQGKGLGAQRNTITVDQQPELNMIIRSTKHRPRTTGRAWIRKNLSIIRAMAPRVGRACCKRIALSMGGA